jgi:hypothetical protein
MAHRSSCVCAELSPAPQRRPEIRRAHALWALVTMIAALMMPERLPAATPRWVQLAPPVGITATLYDSRRQREIVISSNGMWAVSGGPKPSWTYFGAPPPGACVYDPARDRIWAFAGGCCLEPGPGNLWSMDLGVPAPSWTARTFTGFTPIAKLGGFGCALDPVRDRIIVFGGHVVVAVIRMAWLCSPCQVLRIGRISVREELHPVLVRT